MERKNINDGDLLVLKGDEIRSLLAKRETKLIHLVRRTYEAHARGESSLPHSTFLRFNDQKNRIIAMPAYLSHEDGIAGIKWIASFPENDKIGIDRASAVLILNSPLTGRPFAILEGSIISAKRTAASAVLAAQYLHAEKTVTDVGMIGCGKINFETVRFLLAVYPQLKALCIFDKDPKRAQQFKERCENLSSGIDVNIAKDVKTFLKFSTLISFATTAIQPHIFDLSACKPDCTILHISLRDLSPEVILSCDNVVDDPAHVCQAQTSVHLAAQRVGHRDFIRCTLADILQGIAPVKMEADSITVFSPFGLGLLDIAVGQFVYNLSLEQSRGTVLRSFLPNG